jgi:hypothetical protein
LPLKSNKTKGGKSMEQESKQEGVPEEQPKEEISKETPEVTSPEEKATSERTYTEAEWRRMQSMKDTAESKAQRYEQELQELHKRDYERQLADRRRELESLEGDTEGQATVKRKHQLQDEIKDLEEKNKNLRVAVWNKYDQAKTLVKEHNLNPDDIFKLMDETTTETEMRLMAENLGLKVEREKPQPKTPEKTGFKPDSGTSDAGADSDKVFLERWNAGDLPATKENLARARKIVNK